ncbi:MAG: hypothetical protein RLN79_06590 [Cytophagales bacterium]
MGIKTFIAFIIISILIFQIIPTFPAPTPLNHTISGSLETMTVFTLPPQGCFGVYVFLRKTLSFLCMSQGLHLLYSMRNVVSTFRAPAFPYLHTKRGGLPPVAFCTLPPQFGLAVDIKV